MQNMNITISKFGGTSQGNSHIITGVANIVKAKKNKGEAVVVVVSAMSGVTDQLLLALELAQKKKPRLVNQILDDIAKRHRETLGHFVTKNEFENIWREHFDYHIEHRLRHILTGVSYLGEVTDKTKALVCSIGERFSSWVTTYALRKAGVEAERVNATRLIKTDSNYLDANVNFSNTKSNFTRRILPLLKKGITPVITGFIAKDTHGDVTLLGRGGSDYSASVAGICLKAQTIEIWTDVDGIMSANPKVVPEARLWPEVSFQIASEMAHGGAKVLHPRTISPAVEHDIPILIRNTFSPHNPGTLITRKADNGFKGIQMKSGQAIVHLTSAQMLDEPGFIRNSAEIFQSLNTPLDVCTTSEVSVTYSLEQKDLNNKLLKALKRIANVTVYRDLAKVTILGENINKDSKIMARVFATIQGHRLYAVSMGASNHNITLLVEEKDAEGILKRLHKELIK